MITRLWIRHLILIDALSLNFGEGLNILSGESGAGKSALLAAINLLVGKRAEASVVRKGEEKALVEASFSLEDLPQIAPFLEESGILQDEELTITREVSRSGKSRAFVNRQLVPLSFLKDLGSKLLSIVGQHANQKLCVPEYQRNSLDTFGSILGLAHVFSKKWLEEKALEKELEMLKQSETKRASDLDRFQHELNEITEANVQEGEEESLFSEYSRLANSEEIASYCSTIIKALSDDGVLAELNGISREFDKLVALDDTHIDKKEAFFGALLELQDVASTLEAAQSGIEYEPGRLEAINERLSEINGLKRKYGDDFVSYKEELIKRLDDLEHADAKIEEIEKHLTRLKTENDQLALKLTAKRKEVALELQEKMTEELKALNMKGARFEIAVTEQKRGTYGDDHIEFFLAPNKGESPVLVRSCASGGELSRVCLALQALLGKKEEVPTLLFDEIDANIGGATAHVVGQKLHDISKGSQVLCITHFPQVAKFADHHYRIYKEEDNKRTVTKVDALQPHERGEELDRMLGKASLTIDSSKN